MDRLSLLVKEGMKDVIQDKYDFRPGDGSFLVKLTNNTYYKAGYGGDLSGLLVKKLFDEGTVSVLDQHWGHKEIKQVLQTYLGVQGVILANLFCGPMVEDERYIKDNIPSSYFQGYLEMKKLGYKIRIEKAIELILKYGTDWIAYW